MLKETVAVYGHEMLRRRRRRQNTWPVSGEKREEVLVPIERVPFLFFRSSFFRSHFRLGMSARIPEINVSMCDANNLRKRGCIGFGGRGGVILRHGGGGVVIFRRRWRGV